MTRYLVQAAKPGAQKVAVEQQRGQRRRPPAAQHTRFVNCVLCGASVGMARDVSTDPKLLVHFEGTCSGCGGIAMLSFSPKLKGR